MEIEADQLKRGDPQPLRPMGKYHHATYNESSSTKQHLKEGKRQSCCPNRRLVLGFPTTQEGKWIKCSHDALQKGMVPPESGTVSMSFKPTRILPKKISKTLGRSVAPEPCKVEISTPPNSLSTTMRHYGHEVAIIVSPRLPLQGMQDSGGK
jgi:hypothetical protein